MNWLKNFARNSVIGSLSSITFLFAAITLLCASFYTLHPHYDRDFYALYTLGLIFVAFLASAIPLFQPAEERSNRSFYDTGFVLLVFFLALRLSLYRIDFFSIWLDEELQANAAQGANGASIEWAAAFTQMPLSYYFTALNIDLSGLNEWGVRLFSCLFYAGSGALFYRLSKSLCTNTWFRFAAPLVYLLNPWMIRYAQEGRPYACMLFCGLLWLNSAHDLFLFPADRQPFRRLLVLFSCTLLFLLSIAFQPVIFIASVSFALGALLFLSRWRGRVLGLYGAVAVAALSISPLVFFARQRSRDFLNAAPNWSALWQPSDSLRAFPTFLNDLFLDHSYFLVISLALALLLLAAKARFKQSIRISEGMIGIASISCITFAIFFWAAFSLFINYQIYVRYYMMAYPLGLLIIFAVFDRILTFWEERRGNQHAAGFLPIILLAVLMAPGILSLPTVYLPGKFDRWNVNYKEIYRNFMKKGAPGDVAYIIPYQDPGGWEQLGFLSTQFYYRENAPVALANQWELSGKETVSDLIIGDLRRKKPKNIFLTFIEPGQNKASLEKYCSSKTNVTLFSGEKFLICKLSVRRAPARVLQGFFEELLRSLGNQKEAFRIFDILLNLSEYEKNPSKCFSYLADLKKLDGSYPVIQNIVQLHENRCSAL